MKEKTIQISLRVPLSLAERLMERAKKEGRTRQNLILWILQNQL